MDERSPLLGEEAGRQSPRSEEEDRRTEGEVRCSRSGEEDGWRRRIFGVEAVISLHAFSIGLHQVIRSNLMIDKVCSVDLQYSGEVCAHIQEHREEQVEVQQRVTLLNLYISYISTGPCILMPLLLGPWSDRHGRKPVMVVPVLGHIVAELAYIANVYFWSLPSCYLLLCCLYSLGGGTTTLLMGVYSMLADTTQAAARTTRVSILDVTIILGWTLGNFLSAIVYQHFGYYGTFGLTIGCQLGVVCLVLMLPESQTPQCFGW